MRFLLIAAAVLYSSAASSALPTHVDDFRYTVKRGDTLFDLAKRGFKRQVDYRIVQRQNQIADPHKLMPGTTLRIPMRLLRVQLLDAKLISFRGMALVSGGKPRIGMIIREGAILQTGSDAFLALELPDTSLMTLPSRSRIRVTGLHRIQLTGNVVKSFELLDGRVENDIRKIQKPDDRFEVRTPISVTAVRGTRFRVTYGSNAFVSITSVLEGKVAVAVGADSITVSRGLGVVASATGTGRPQHLLARPALVNPDRLQDDELVSFKVVPEAGAADYRIQIASDAGFIGILAERESGTPDLSFADMPNGSLFARVTALSGEGVEGFPSDYSFERWLNNIKGEVDKVDACPAHRCLRFRWLTDGIGERRFRFQLTSRPGGIPVIDEPDMSATEIVVTDLPGGIYYWRVESTLIESGRRRSKWMDYQELQVASPGR